MPHNHFATIAAAFAAAAMVFIATLAQAQESYQLDSTHTFPMFEVTHMGFSQQRGTFDKATGRITLDRAARTGSLEVSIDTASISTGNAPRDRVLRSEDWFDSTRYPTMTYRSSSIVFAGDAVIGVNGELTLRGVTRPVTLKVSGFTCGTHPFNKRPMCGAEATALIKRSEFGMTAGIPTAASDEVRITIPVEAFRE